jgi:hypothetical protein
MKSIQLAHATALWLALSLHPSWAHEAAEKSIHATAMTDEQNIQHTMKSLFDKPDAPLKVAPVSVEGGYSVAGWIQGNRGGRALLKKEKGEWSILVCGGDDLKKASSLSMAGMTPKSARKLAQIASAAENNLPADELKKFSMLEGAIRTDGSPHGPHPEKQGHAGHSSPRNHPK